MDFVLETLKSYFLYAKTFFVPRCPPSLSLLYRALERNLKIISHVRNNNFSYTQLSHVFFFFFFSSSRLRPFFVFFLIFLQNGFDIFHMLLFEAFLCFFDNIYLPFIYIYPKIFIKKSYLLYYFQFSSSEFSSSEFSLSKSKEISISSMRYLGIFFSLTTYLNYSSENTLG